MTNGINLKSVVFAHQCFYIDKVITWKGAKSIRNVTFCIRNITPESYWNFQDRFLYFALYNLKDLNRIISENFA